MPEDSEDWVYDQEDDHDVRFEGMAVFQMPWVYQAFEALKAEFTAGTPVPSSALAQHVRTMRSYFDLYPVQTMQTGLEMGLDGEGLDRFKDWLRRGHKRLVVNLDAFDEAVDDYRSLVLDRLYGLETD